MKQFKPILFSLLFLSLTFNLNAQSSGDENKFSLQQCIDFALAHQSAYLNAQIDEEISKRKVQEILGLSMPQISASGGLNDYIEIPTSLLPGEVFGAPAGTYIPVKFGTQYSASGGLEIGQLVADGQYFVAIQATKALKEFTSKSTERTKIETITTVTKAYYNALIANKRMDLLNSNVDRIAKLASDSKVMFDNGFIEQLDLDRINILNTNLKTEQDKISKLVDLSKYLLMFQMGMDVNSKLTLTDTLKPMNFESVLSANFDPQDRIEMQLLNNAAALYRLDIKRNKVAYFPSVYAFGSYSYQAQSNKFDLFGSQQKWYPTGIIGLKLSVPIFDGLQKARKIQQGKLNLDKNTNDQLNLNNGLTLQYMNAKTQLQNATQSLQSQEDNMKLAEKVYNATKSKYEQGVGSNTDLLEAESSLKESQTNYLSALYDAMIAQTDYLNATGQIK
ncbi:MAG: TolC family protein [Sphingobacteriales bacterium]|nr:MAG: TolC family protein [Sphingobacteriales bacterium]